MTEPQKVMDTRVGPDVNQSGRDFAILLVSGVHYTSTNPITENHYLYAGANPVNYVDFTGHDLQIDVGIATTEAVGIDTWGNGPALALAAAIAAGGIGSLQLAPQVETVAAALDVPVESDFSKIREIPGNVYFVHGSSTSAWSGASSIDVTAGRSNLDFGLGFYAFKLDGLWSFEAAADRARQKSVEGGFGFLLIVSMSTNDFDALSSVDFNMESASDYTQYVTANRSGAPDFYSGFDLIIGPIGRKDAMGQWVPNRQFPDRYVFKTINAGAKLKPVAIIPVIE